MNKPALADQLAGCAVLPPLESDTEPDIGTLSKAKGPGNRHQAAERFAVLNAFVDFALKGLTRNEIAVWLVLYRDTRNGVVKTSQADIARRAPIARGRERSSCWASPRRRGRPSTMTSWLR